MYIWYKILLTYFSFRVHMQHNMSQQKLTCISYDTMTKLITRQQWFYLPRTFPKYKNRWNQNAKKHVTPGIVILFQLYFAYLCFNLTRFTILFVCYWLNLFANSNSQPSPMRRCNYWASSRTRIATDYDGYWFARETLTPNFNLTLIQYDLRFRKY